MAKENQSLIDKIQGLEQTLEQAKHKLIMANQDFEREQEQNQKLREEELSLQRHFEQVKLDLRKLELEKVRLQDNLDFRRKIGMPARVPDQIAHSFSRQTFAEHQRTRSQHSPLRLSEYGSRQAENSRAVLTQRQSPSKSYGRNSPLR